MVREILSADELAIDKGFINPITIAEAHGIVVRMASLEEALSGFLVHNADGTPFIGVNVSDTPARKRFTIAHELGHYFLHDRSEVFLDKTSGKPRIVANRDPLSKEGTDVREIEANLFAAELLMPADWIIRDLERYTHIDLFGDENESVIRDLATKYQVSVRAMTIRLERLGFLSEV
jgi:Zn-dependent peptidase ImmA (M78 family)